MLAHSASLNFGFAGGGYATHHPATPSAWATCRKRGRTNLHPMLSKLRPLALILVAFAAGSATAQDPPFGSAGDPALKQAPIGLRLKQQLGHLCLHYHL